MPQFLKERLDNIAHQNRLRKLSLPIEGGIDFFSNDYLGLVKNKKINYAEAANKPHGATGSRLISGNFKIHIEAEKMIAEKHKAEAALIFNSGYDANLGLFSSLGIKGNTIVYDEYIHASIRDGIKLSNAFALVFQHNNLAVLEQRLQQAQGTIFVAVESIYSMDGDTSDLLAMVDLCKKYDAHLIVDEAHAFGLYGKSGMGLVEHFHLEKECFARIYTYGKAMGLHGASVVGSQILIQYLINTARSFIYTTALSPHQVYCINKAYEAIESFCTERKQLDILIKYFQKQKTFFQFLKSATAIQGLFMLDNNVDILLRLCNYLELHNFWITPIRYPTVPKGKERLRICLHAFNTTTEIDELFFALNYFKPQAF